MSDTYRLKDIKLLDLNNLTNGDFDNNSSNSQIWEGDKILDKLLGVVTKILDKQYSQGRITGQEYSSLVASLTNTALQLSLEYLKNLSTLEITKEKTSAEIDKTEEEKNFAIRQRMGFNDQIYFKLFEIQANAFSVLFSSGLLNEVDTGPFKASAISTIYTDLKTRVEKILSAQNDYDLLKD